MPQLNAYHRPKTVAEALELLQQEDVHCKILAGGTHLVPTLAADVDEVVDLQATGLDQIENVDGRLTIGAMVRLQAIVDDKTLPPLLRETARRAGPNTFRNQETVGGTIVTASAESELLAALLVHNTNVTVETLAGKRTLPLADFLADVEGGLQDGLLTSVSLDTGGETAHARVARTPEDNPIVAAVARRAGPDTFLALCGVAATPILVGRDDLDTLEPPADFRGSSQYRKEMALVLARRTLKPE